MDNYIVSINFCFWILIITYYIEMRTPNVNPLHYYNSYVGHKFKHLFSPWFQDFYRFEFYDSFIFWCKLSISDIIDRKIRYRKKVWLSIVKCSVWLDICQRFDSTNHLVIERLENSSHFNELFCIASHFLWVSLTKYEVLYCISDFFIILELFCSKYKRMNRSKMLNILKKLNSMMKNIKRDTKKWKQVKSFDFRCKQFKDLNKL